MNERGAPAGSAIERPMVDPALVETVREELARSPGALTPHRVAEALRALGPADRRRDRARGPRAAPTGRARSGSAGAAAASARRDRRAGQRPRPGVLRPRRRAGAGERPVRGRAGSAPAGPATGRRGRATTRRRLALRRRPAPRRHPLPRRAGARGGPRHAAVVARPVGPRLHAGGAGRRRTADRWRGAAAGGGGRGPARIPGHRRHRLGQDHAAVRVARAGVGHRARARRGGRRGAAPRPPPRGDPRGTAGQPARARVRSRCARWSVRHCGCAPTGWSSARCAEARSSTCWQRSTPATTAAAARSTPTPPPMSPPGSRRWPWPRVSGGRPRTASSRPRCSVVLHLGRDAEGVRRLQQVAVPVRAPDGLVTMADAFTLVDGRLCRQPAATALEERLG